MNFDPGELRAAVSRALGGECSLTPLAVKCTFPVFRGECAGGGRVFVKLGPREEWERTLGVQRDLGDCRFLAKLLVTEPVECGGHAVFIAEWRDTRTVFPEDMTESEAESFVDGCREFSSAIGGTSHFTPLAESAADPRRLYDTVAGFVRRHPVAGRLISELVAIPESERTYTGHVLTVTHGDFHARNLGFEDGRFTCVYDFDKLTEGLACGDMVNALVERYSLMRMSAAGRRRLAAVTRRIFRSSPWPADELRIAVNVLRLAFAARRIARHPDSSWIVLDILRRDRRIRAILDALDRCPRA